MAHGERRVGERLGASLAHHLGGGDALGLRLGRGVEEPPARGRVDNVNLKSADCTTVSVPVAPTHMRHANQRTLAVFGCSSFLFSAGRSLRRYDLLVIFSIVQWWQTLSAMALAATSSPNTPAQPPIPTLVVMIVERCSYRVDTSWNMRSAPCSSMSR